jgi:neutral ceramidase
MLVALIAPLLMAQTGLSVATATVDITPSEPLPLGGYTERGTKVSIPGGDRLFARTLLFQSGRSRIAVVSVETLTIPESLVKEVKKRIPPDVDLFLAATHTHSAPDSQLLNDQMTFQIPGIASYRPKWLAWYADQISASVKQALLHPRPVESVFARQGHADFNIGRRKFADPDKMVTEVFDYPERRKGQSEPSDATPLLLEYAAHGTVYGAKELHLRGDWPGVAAKKFGAEVIQGAIGDVLPKDWGPTPEQSIAKIVKGLSDGLFAGKASYVWRQGDAVGAVDEPIALDPIEPHPTMAKSYGVPEAFAESIVKQFAPPRASIVAFRVGKLAVVGVPGEPTSILGRQIRDAGLRMGYTSVLVCSHVNGWMGYILDPEDYDRGGYEATLSFYGREEGAKVVAAGIEALKALKR